MAMVVWRLPVTWGSRVSGSLSCPKMMSPPAFGCGAVAVVAAGAAAIGVLAGFWASAGLLSTGLAAAGAAVAWPVGAVGAGLGAAGAQAVSRTVR